MHISDELHKTIKSTLLDCSKELKSAAMNPCFVIDQTVAAPMRELIDDINDLINDMETDNAITIEVSGNDYAPVPFPGDWSGLAGCGIDIEPASGTDAVSVTEPFRITGPGKYRQRDGEVREIEYRESPVQYAGHDYHWFAIDDPADCWRCDGFYGSQPESHSNLVAKVEDE